MPKLRWLAGATAILTAGLMIGTLMPAASEATAAVAFKVCDKEKNVKETVIDVGREKFSPGDYSVQTEPLFDVASGNKVGRLVGVFTFIRSVGQRDGHFRVEITSAFEDGKVEIGGASKFSNLGNGAVFPVLGGTGKYQYARGTMTVNEKKCDGDRGAELTFELLLD